MGSHGSVLVERTNVQCINGEVLCSVDRIADNAFVAATSSSFVATGSLRSFVADALRSALCDEARKQVIRTAAKFVRSLQQYNATNDATAGSVVHEVSECALRVHADVTLQLR